MTDTPKTFTGPYFTPSPLI